MARRRRPQLTTALTLVAACFASGLAAWLASACGGGSGAGGDGGSDAGDAGLGDSGSQFEVSTDTSLPDVASQTDGGLEASHPLPDAPSGDAVLVPVGSPAFNLTSLGASLTTAPFAVLAADFNGDHFADVVASAGTATFDNSDVTAPGNTDSSTTILLLGKGDGTFQAPTTVIAAHTMSPLLVGNLNSDQNLDLIAGGQVLLGQGDGTFQAASSQPAVGCIGALGDIDGDGKLDLAGYNSHAVVADGGDGGGAHGFICLGNGDGTFQAPLTFSSTLAPTTILLGDLTGDNQADIVLAQDSSAGAPALSVFLSTVGGVAGPEQMLPGATFAPGDLRTLVLADLTADGKKDLASSRPGVSGEPSVALLVGAGDGTFAPAVAVSAPSTLNPGTGHTNGIISGDINGDGHPDLLFGSADDPLVWTALAGDPAAPFAVPFVSVAPQTVPEPAAVADFNGDGVSDILVLEGDALQVVLAAKTAVFPAPSLAYLAPAGSRSLAVGDLNGDGLSDFAIAGGTGVSAVTIYLSATSGRYLVPATSLATESASSPALVIADLNGDHVQDLAIAESGGVGVFLGQGNAAFAAEQVVGGVVPLAIQVADVNGDHFPDLVVGTSGGVQPLLNKGTGSFTVGAVAPSSLSGASLFALGDLNKDGRIDLVLATSTTNAQIGSSSSFTVSLGNGDGTFTALTPVTTITGVEAAALTLVDVNADGDLDLVLSADVDSSQPDIQLFLGAGNGTFTQAPAVSLGIHDPGSAGPLVLGNFRGTGHVDIATGAGADGGVFALIPGNGDSTFGNAVAVQLVRPPTGGAPTLLATGSFAQGQVSPAIGLSGKTTGLVLGLRRATP
jgi:hypothetical protein